LPYDVCMKFSVLAAVLWMGMGGLQSWAQVASAASVCAVIEPDANDGVLVAPANHKVLYEDADVRVIEVTVLPHAREVMHTHARPAVMYFEEASAQRYITPEHPDPKAYPAPVNFRPFVRRLKPEGLHAMENPGETRFRAIRVELKHPGCSLDGSPVVPLGPEDAVVAAPANHTVLYEDDDVRVLDVHSQPHTREAWHTHAWSGVFYVIQGIPTRLYTPEKTDPPLRPAPPNGKVMYAPADGMHSVANEGDVAGDRLRIELKFGSKK
jgi:mannose-6-phosphate isomerase-like protein (cupin superfamily)